MNKRSPHFWIATWFGSGLSPKAPGTVGTLATVPAHFLLIELSTWGHALCLIGLVFVGTLSADKLARDMQLEDPQLVVIDESAGVLLALFLAGATTLVGVVAAVLLFRLFDITKPWPINAAERLKPAGVGIMADDIVAGIAAGLGTLLLLQFTGL